MKDEFNSWLKERYRPIAADFCKRQRYYCPSVVEYFYGCPARRSIRRWLDRGRDCESRQFAFRAINAFKVASITAFSSLLSASANTSAHAACSSSIENVCPASIRAFPLGEASIATKRCFRSVIVAPSQGVNGPHRGAANTAGACPGTRGTNARGLRNRPMPSDLPGARHRPDHPNTALGGVMSKGPP
jgi:hypothetical protein